MDPAPLVSIGIPAFNEERFLRKTLASLLAQDYPSLELVITDNGSVDGTWAILEEAARVHPNIRLNRFPENRGAIQSFNDVFRRAQGTFFMWAGAHDLWDSSYVSRCVRILQEERKVVGVYARTELIDEQDRRMTDYKDAMDTRGKSLLGRYAYILWNLTYCNLIHGVWRRELLGRSDLFKETWGPDNLVIAHMSVEGEFAQIKDTLFFRRQVRPEEDREAKDARILYSLDPKPVTKQATDLRLLHYNFRRAHLRMVRRLPVGIVTRTLLTIITLYIFAIRFYLFPGGQLIRRIVQLVPPGAKQKAYTMIRGTSHAS